MKKKKDEKLVAKNMFKTKNLEERKSEFNKKYSNYINFSENKT